MRPWVCTTQLKGYAFPLNNWGSIASNMTPGVANGICLTICKLETENCYFSFYNSYIKYNNILISQQNQVRYSGNFQGTFLWVSQDD